MMLSWDELESACNSCTDCALCRNRNHVVIGVGRRDADVMFIGEGPGEQEDLIGQPFVGAAGKLLDDMMSIIDLDRTNTYIANIVKCRPPQNRTPLEEEAEACIGHLRAQVALVRPAIIVCLGATAARYVYDRNVRITRDRGIWKCSKGVWILPTYHPAALLRDESKKREAWDDLKKLRAKYEELYPESALKAD